MNTLSKLLGTLLFAILFAVAAATTLAAAAANDVAAKAEAAKVAEAAKAAGEAQASAAKAVTAAREAGAVIPSTSPVDLRSTEIYTKSLAALTMLLVIAVLLENAFAIIFNWRLFLAYVDARGTKTIIMIVISLIIVLSFNIDIVASLVDAYKTPNLGEGSESNFFSKLVTALILAGGSSGVYNIMYALGYRKDRGAEEKPKGPEKNKAWVAIRVVRKDVVGAVIIRIQGNRSHPPSRNEAIGCVLGCFGAGA